MGPLIIVLLACVATYFAYKYFSLQEKVEQQKEKNETIETTEITDVQTELPKEPEVEQPIEEPKEEQTQTETPQDTSIIEEENPVQESVEEPTSEIIEEPVEELKPEPEIEDTQKDTQEDTKQPDILKEESEKPKEEVVAPANPGTFTYSFGGSECTCTPSESIKYADRRAARFRSPIMKVSETVSYTIETPDGYDMSVSGPNGSRKGIFNANTDYVIYCAALPSAQEVTSKITLSNSSGTKVIMYRLYNPNFSVDYKNETSATISDIKCVVKFDDGTEKVSTYQWPISAGKDKSDAWIDTRRNSVKEAYNVTVAGKAVQTKISGLGTKEITIVIK